MSDVPPATRAQYDRITVQVRRGKVVLLAGSAIILLALLIATFRGAAGLRSWLVLPAVLLLAAVFHLADRRLTSRPPGAVEVPEDLADTLVDLQEICDDIVEYVVDTLPPAEYERVVRTAREHVASSIVTANEVLAAERSGDFAAASPLRAAIQASADELQAAHDALVPSGDVNLRADGHDFNLAPDGYGTR